MFVNLIPTLCVGLSKLPRVVSSGYFDVRHESPTVRRNALVKQSSIAASSVSLVGLAELFFTRFILPEIKNSKHPKYALPLRMALAVLPGLALGEIVGRHLSKRWKVAAPTVENVMPTEPAFGRFRQTPVPMNPLLREQAYPYGYWA